MEKINQKIFEFLLEKNLTISFCESASGGALSSLICEFDGASNVFKGSLITYSNESKINIAKVNPHNIETFGAISEQVAYEMSHNTNKLLKSDICISITGNASENIMEEKACCHYFIGITIVDKTYVHEINLKNINRNINRLNIAYFALEKLWELFTIKK